ncbi:protein-L-isoaspartate O-methyltransferase [Streptomyces exfoliatus]|uniref:protein-L-isoaspartate O-methyltransferase n=1 Tax=Streptomyces exfoliatus TaxID=1905 RepID=UPI0037ACDEB6
MSSTMGMTADLLQLLDLRPGQRLLDVGTGAGVTAAVACFVCGDAGVVTLDIDPHVTAAARERLSVLGYQPTAATGDGTTGWPDAGAYDRIFVSFAVRRVPTALVEQLAPGGRALMTLGTSSPSWPGLAVIDKRPDGTVEAELRAVEFGHRAGAGFDRLFLSAAFRDTTPTGHLGGDPGRRRPLAVGRRTGRLPPPPRHRRRSAGHQPERRSDLATSPPSWRFTVTRPDQPAPEAALDDALFGAEAADCARHRPGLSDRAVHLLAAPSTA